MPGKARKTGFSVNRNQINYFLFQLLLSNKDTLVHNAHAPSGAPALCVSVRGDSKGSDILVQYHKPS